MLDDVTFRLLKGEHVGLIGANGEGKSTFLNIITGELMPDAGKVEWSNRVTVGYLDQHTRLTPGKTIRDILREAFARLFELEREMQEAYEKMAAADEEEMNKLLEAVGDIQDILDHSGFYTIDANVEAVANGLGLGSIGLDREVQDLSGGQRTKVLLAKLLLEQPSILLLDEPTNFLDEEHIAWLVKYLQDYENAFILITHDIDFLNKVINVIYHVEQGRLTRYVGDYNKFMELYEINKARHQQAYEKQQKEIDRLEDFVARNKARISTTGRAKSRQKQLEKMELIDKPREKVKPTFKFQEARAAGKIIFKADGLQIGYDRALTRPLDIMLERGQKIAIRGCNGLG
ncbi:ABC-F family ATP-binding cassette domain-containing protein, partial [bacterium]